MEFLDRETLKCIAKGYDDSAIASAVVKIVTSDNEADTPSLEECVLKYIRILEGTRVRVKEIHWSAKSSTVHMLMDSLSAFIMSYEDAIAESFMGVCGFRIKVGQVVPEIPEISDHEDIVEYLSIQTMGLLRLLVQDPKYIGLTKKLEDMYCELNKFTYLATQE